MFSKEYEELLGQGDNSSTSSLSTIEERANWEKQLNDLEEESEAQLKHIALLETQLEQLQKERLEEQAANRREMDQLAADLQSTQSRLIEVVEREAKLSHKLECLRDASSKSPNRPLSPTPKPGLLPPGYSPLKSKGWAKNQRQQAPCSSTSSSPCKSFEMATDGVDGRTPKVSLSRATILPYINQINEIAVGLAFDEPKSI